MADQGWIKLHRSISTNPLWTQETFSRGQAWVDLILMVNHEDKKILFDGGLVECKRGERILSIRQLAERWKWSRGKVTRFLDMLQSDQMIVYKTDHKKTTVNIVNYNVYQDKPTQEKPVNGQKRASDEPLTSHRRTTDEPLTDTNKNDKELIKNDKEQQERKEEDLSLLSLYETLGFGTINSIIAADIGLLEKDYTETWVQEALKEANDQGKRNLSYVKGILKNWKTNGFKAERPKQNYEKKEPGTGFNNFKARDYDYDNLEKKLLGWGD